MFSCVKRSDSGTIDSHVRCKKTHIENVLEHINSQKNKNCRLRFLILLRDEDYEKCFYSRRDWIHYRKAKFPGKLIIDRFSEIDNLPYNIEGPPVPRKVYIMLPKEKLFIPSDNFTSRYMDSKLSELKSIFVGLQAKTIKMTKLSQTEESRKGNIDGNVSVPRIGKIGTNTSVVSSNNTTTMYMNEMTFNEPTESIKSELFSSDSFYYLDKQYEWQQMIIRRIDNKMVTDKYVYKNRESELFNVSTLQSLRRLNLSVNYDWEKVSDLEIHYEIEYYDIDYSTLREDSLTIEDINPVL